MAEMTHEEIKQICDRVERVVNSKGSCGIRWAINKQYGYEADMPQTEHRAQKIIGSLIKSNEYISHLSPDNEYYIYKNPAHLLYLEQKKQSDKQTKINFWIAVITALNVLFVGVSIFQTCNSKTEKVSSKGITEISNSVNNLNRTVSDLNGNRDKKAIKDTVLFK
jgi:hypothetical protein